MAPTRFALTLIGIFAGVAAALAAVGLYGVLSTAVRQRTAEIGIRMTFGASRNSIVQMIVGHGLRLSAAGIGIGLVGALALTRVMQSLLVGVAPTDPITFVTIAVFFLGVAALACWLPALRAGGLDPNVVLREE
jgi:putative ABC transport system permease protein